MIITRSSRNIHSHPLISSRMNSTFEGSSFVDRLFHATRIENTVGETRQPVKIWRITTDGKDGVIKLASHACGFLYSLELSRGGIKGEESLKEVAATTRRFTFSGRNFGGCCRMVELLGHSLDIRLRLD